jgi:hypothetical protein
MVAATLLWLQWESKFFVQLQQGLYAGEKAQQSNFRGE